MRKKVTQIEKVAGNDATKIWRIIKSVALVENMSAEADITKKLVFARMAEAEANGHPLSYDTIEAIIENDTVSAGGRGRWHAKILEMPDFLHIVP